MTSSGTLNGGGVYGQFFTFVALLFATVVGIAFAVSLFAATSLKGLVRVWGIFRVIASNGGTSGSKETDKKILPYRVVLSPRQFSRSLSCNSLCRSIVRCVMRRARNIKSRGLEWPVWKESQYGASKGMAN